MSISNSTVSELHHFVMQPLLLMAIRNLHVLMHTQNRTLFFITKFVVIEFFAPFLSLVNVLY